MNFGECIRLFREEAGLNKSQLAREMDVTPAMIRAYEKKTSIPKAETVEKFAKGLNKPLEEVIKRCYGLGGKA